MSCLKKIKVIMFLLGFVATAQVITMIRTERLIKTVDAFEPMVIEPVQEAVKSEINVEETTLKVNRVVSDLLSMDPFEFEIMEPRIDCPLNDDIQQMIVEKCEEYDIDFALAMAVIFKESSFKSSVVSTSNDYGLMQINKINHEWLSEELGITDFLDPEQNVTAGLYMLKNLFEKYDNPAMVLMAYNMGETGACRLWIKGIYYTDYAESILQQADIYNAEIAERMGENDSM